MNVRKAWYIDDGIILSGMYVQKRFSKWFYPDAYLQCGFDVQKIWKKDIGTTLFFAKWIAESALRFANLR